MTTTDCIEKSLTINAPRSRVWRAIASAKEFGEWFRVNLQGEFAAGQSIIGSITHPGYEHLKMELVVDRIEPERYFSYRWHPYAVDPAVDYSSEASTLVELFLEDADGGTLLKIVESGFDNIPAARRDEAFRMNSGGWAAQLENIEKYVAR